MTIQAAIAPVAPTTAVTSTKTKKEREQPLADIQAALAPYGVRTEITPYSNRHFLADFITPQIRANIDLDARSEEHTSELQSLMRISYAVFCLKTTNQTTKTHNT